MCVCVKDSTFPFPTLKVLRGKAESLVGLFCKRSLQKRQYSAQETYVFKDPTNRSHPIS